MKLNKIISEIKPINNDIKNKCIEKFNKLAIPIGSLGELQELIANIAAIKDTLNPSVAKKAVVVFCADNGVVDEGISQVGHEVTTAVAKNLCLNNTVMCKMAEFAKVDVVPVDIGMIDEISDDRLINKKVANGTKNFLYENSMTNDEAIKAIESGIEIAVLLYEKGYEMLLCGEMGIGNTTTSTAMTAILLDADVEDITGRGAGLSDDALLRKKEIIKKSIDFHNPNKNDIIDVLSKVGGFDIAGIIGLILGCAYCKIPCVIDGYISNVSALCASMLCENARGYMIFSHTTAEQGGKMLLKKLSAKPIINANMRLGEGTGAITLVPIIDMAMKIYKENITFSDININEYKPF